MDFLKYFQNLAVFWHINPENFENSLKSPYEVKMKEGLFFDCGQPLIDISVHSFLITQFQFESKIIM